MTDYKYADDEIIKALEICTKSKGWGDCEDMGCPAATKHGCYFYLRTAEDYEGVVQDELLKDALALINRQKAEIERLKNSRDRWKQIATDFDKASRETEKEIERLTTLAELGNMRANDYREMRNKLKKANAEIERLKKIGDDKTSEILRHATAIGELHKQLETARAEAIKEFAERLKKRARMPLGTIYGKMVYLKDIDNLVKEMTEGKNEKI